MDTAGTPILDDIRLSILRQHTQLGQLLDELEGAAKDVQGGIAESPTALHHALDLFYVSFMRHLDFEETHLGTQLNGDHVDQRSRVEGLVHDRSVFADARTLAAEASVFVHAIRKDMKLEEDNLRSRH